MEKGRKMKKIEAKNCFESMSNLTKGPLVKFDCRFGFPEESRGENTPNIDQFELGEISVIDAQSPDEEILDCF